MMAPWNPAGDVDNDGRWPDGHEVMVRFPLAQWEPPDGITDDEAQRLMMADRETWPWLPGQIASQFGPDEWEVVALDDRLATLEDGSLATQSAPPEDLHYPLCFRTGRRSARRSMRLRLRRMPSCRRPWRRSARRRSRTRSWGIRATLPAAARLDTALRRRRAGAGMFTYEGSYRAGTVRAILALGHPV